MYEFALGRSAREGVGEGPGRKTKNRKTKKLTNKEPETQIRKSGRININTRGHEQKGQKSSGLADGMEKARPFQKST